jgi:protein-S-isoprenylcysteine O-methyltransferase Ste14
MQTPQNDTPGVIAPPPLIYLGLVAIGLALDHFWPMRLLPPSWCMPLAGFPILLGLVILALGLLQLRRVGTHVSPHQPTTALANAGIYRYTRNPLYLSLTLVYLGIAVATNGLWLLLLAIPLLLVMRYGVIGREERYLESKFGDTYRQYRARVRRWL